MNCNDYCKVNPGDVIYIEANSGAVKVTYFINLFLNKFCHSIQLKKLIKDMLFFFFFFFFAFQRVGRCDAYASEFDLEAEEVFCLFVLILLVIMLLLYFVESTFNAYGLK